MATLGVVSAPRTNPAMTIVPCGPGHCFEVAPRDEPSSGSGRHFERVIGVEALKHHVTVLGRGDVVTRIPDHGTCCPGDEDLAVGLNGNGAGDAAARLEPRSARAVLAEALYQHRVTGIADSMSRPSFCKATPSTSPAPWLAIPFEPNPEARRTAANAADAPSRQSTAARTRAARRTRPRWGRAWSRRLFTSSSCSRFAPRRLSTRVPQSMTIWPRIGRSTMSAVGMMGRPGRARLAPWHPASSKTTAGSGRLTRASTTRQSTRRGTCSSTGRSFFDVEAYLPDGSWSQDLVVLRRRADGAPRSRPVIERRLAGALAGDGASSRTSQACTVARSAHTSSSDAADSHGNPAGETGA